MGYAYLHSLNNIHKAFYVGIFLNTVFLIIEFIVGYNTQSLALISDASHNLGDVTSLIISLIGLKLSQKAATLTRTYGYKKMSILASFINAILLILIVINIFKEGIERLTEVSSVSGPIIIVTAFIGVLVNLFSAFLFYKDQKHDINIKGAFIHLLVDAIVSIGVVISGVIIYFTQWDIIDPIISFVIAFVVLITTWGLLKESLRLISDGVPKEINVQNIQSIMEDFTGIKKVYHLHIWALSSCENAMTAHVVFDNDLDFSATIKVKEKLKQSLVKKNIHHVTLEI